MKMTGALIGAVVTVLVLAGCSAHSDPSSPAQKSVATATAAPTAESTPASTTDAKDAAFVTKVRAVSPGISYSDAELIAYGEIACAQLLSGSEKSAITVIPGSDLASFDQNSTVVSAAKQNLCP